ncbi:transcriptional regulator, TetR family [Ruegeria halocynthiae]|uniref:Transcriptional regulator, TetR family n=1 Tax=Ruegeria halocynthiae TaxID=985054 RepID=A0A1H3FK99_9RHOB|nr:TetR/AcrR family transcriptional regulator [Ruegeria halocynthiae]SDX91421.1 transcriptional regulator, TetR family [Ruegeria halocynthiae]
MSDKKQAQRRRQIESAALELLAVKGYRKTSMLQIAKRASASNQTLYAWYGNKQALFKDIIDLNGRAVRGFLKHALNEHEDPLQVLKSLGIHLLRFTTDSKAITMNRAAITDATETSVLAEAIDSVGRNEVFALICSLMDDLAKRGTFGLDLDAEDAANSYISLLFGEVQMRQALGVMLPLTEEEIHERAVRAFELTCRLYKNPN